MAVEQADTLWQQGRRTPCAMRAGGQPVEAGQADTRGQPCEQAAVVQAHELEAGPSLSSSLTVAQWLLGTLDALESRREPGARGRKDL